MTLIDNMRWVSYCYRSLLTMKPALTIEQVRQYCLIKYMIIMDEPEELDGTFQRVEDP